MDRYHIQDVLVHEYHARSLYPLEHGNRRLLELIRGYPRLHPVWVLEPPVMPGIQPSENVVDEMLAAGVKVARLRMKIKGTLAWLWDDLCTALESHSIPFF